MPKTPQHTLGRFFLSARQWSDQVSFVTSRLPGRKRSNAVNSSSKPNVTEREDRRSWLRKIAEFLHPGPDSKDELIEALADAHENKIIGSDSRDMLEGVIRMSELCAGDVMLPLGRIDMVSIHAPYEEMLNSVIDTGHSRFPVYEGSRENIIGILLAKDLLKLQRAPELNVRALLRPTSFVPESKGLNELLREFKGNRNHLAVVVDEFGRVAGLITIEDVLEQIVGEIEDEFDISDDEGDIFGLSDRTYRVNGDTALTRVEEAFNVSLAHASDGESIETIGGLIAHDMGHVPKRGEQHCLGGLRFTVLHTKGGAVRWFRVEPADMEPRVGETR
ncbi:transporter associated domain-containing protein [Curvibacter sp. APW13]|uniref:HlyC/CorC family transporter n=1 Tax=Curvibacter sp. APW13 TaxID=3077236 RepID=UPI0028DF3C91|nr:transporter associated domain-containing protein [Curvibacter sp. APW13]MDT8989758.1 transporter associated domain-containing protein [Curvibacter sp. APW13]